MRIPFTNFIIQKLPQETGVEKRPLVFLPRSSQRPDKDLSGFRVDFRVFYQAYKAQADIYSCIREWKQNTGTAGYRLFNPERPDDSLPAGVERELMDILNFDQDFLDLKDQTVEALGISGNAYWAYIRSASGNRVLGIQPLDPRTISKVTDNNGNVYRYIQQHNGNTVVFEPEEILHFKLGLETNNAAFGTSPMERVLWEARTDLNAMMTNHNFFENDAQPALQYIFEDGMSEEDMQAAIDIIKKEFSGAKNKHKPMAMAGIKEVKVLSMTHKDMEFLSGRRFSTEKICSVYGVPKFMLGYTESVNNNNGIELTQNAYNSTFKPIESILERNINRGFLDRIGLKGKVQFEFLPQLKDQSALEKSALEELKAGAITLRQYKVKTGQDVTPSDEQNPMIDAYIIHSGGSAVRLEDVGVDPVVNPNDPQSGLNFIKALEDYSYAKN